MNSAFTTPRALVAVALIAISLCLTLVSCGGAEDPKRLLQLKLYPKDAFILYVSGETDIIIGDIIPNLGGPFEVTYRWDVLSVDPEGNIEFKVSVKSASFSVFMRPLGRAFEDTTFKLRMAADGEILGFEGTDEMRTQVAANLKFPLIEQRKKADPSSEDYIKTIESAKQGVLAHIQDEALRGLFEPLFRVWPAIPVAPGDEWTLEQISTYLHVPNGGSFVTTEFEVTSWNDGEVTLSTQGVLQTPDTDEANSMSGTTHGTIILDAIGGFLKSASLKRAVKGRVTLPFDEQSGGSPIMYKEEIFVEVLKL